MPHGVLAHANPQRLGLPFDGVGDAIDNTASTPPLWASLRAAAQTGHRRRFLA